MTISGLRRPVSPKYSFRRHDSSTATRILSKSSTIFDRSLTLAHPAQIHGVDKPSLLNTSLGGRRAPKLGACSTSANAGGVVVAAHGDVHGWAHGGAGGQRPVHGVALELGDDLRVRLHTVVNGHIGLLVEDVVEPRGPLAGAQAGGVGAVVHHEGHAAGVHVGVQRVNGLDDGLVADLGVGVALLCQGLHGGHHDGDVDARGEGVDGDVLAALGAHLLAHLPHVGLVDLAHGPPVEALDGIDDGLDLIAAGHVLVDLVADVHGGADGGGIGLLEDLLALSVEGLVDAQHAVAGDDLGDGAGDGLNRLLESLLVAAHRIKGNRKGEEIRQGISMQRCVKQAW